MTIAIENPTAAAAPQRFRTIFDWLGVAPFILFALLFLVLPMMSLVAGAFQTPDGSFTLNNLRELFTPSIASAFWVSVKISLASSDRKSVV